MSDPLLAIATNGPKSHERTGIRVAIRSPNVGMAGSVLDRLALVTTGMVVTAALGWLVFHPALVGAIDVAVTMVVLLSRPAALRRQ